MLPRRLDPDPYIMADALVARRDARRQPDSSHNAAPERVAAPTPTDRPFAAWLRGLVGGAS